jgi:hypothetical protein
MDVSLPHGVDLGLGSAAAATDDRPGMAHTAARRRSQSGNKPDNRL